MTEERFIKYIPSEEAKYLAIHHPNAFILLMFIAESARRYDGHPDGLKPGQCHIGDWKSYGFSEQNYRTAKKVLEQRQHLKIIETNRTRKKSTTGLTTAGTLVELTSTTVYDINIELPNDRPNDCLTTDQRLTNDKLRKNKKEKKEEEKEKIKKENAPLPEKIHFRDFVTLTQAEHDKLLALHGAPEFTRMLDLLNSYKGRSGKTYNSDYHAMDSGSWVVTEAKRLNTHETAQKPSLNGSQPSGEPRFKAGRVLSVKGDSGNVL
jgi:hypothetical protein